MTDTTALVPTIPDDRQLAKDCPCWVDFAGIADLLADAQQIGGKELFHMDGGDIIVQQLNDADTQLKKFIKEFIDWYPDTDMAALERWGQKAADRRLGI